jgi:hypothetical protein
MNKTAKTFFGFALADSMFAAVGACTITRRMLTVEMVAEKVVRGVISCCNPSHEATVSVMRARFELHVEIPDFPPRVNLERGDSVIVMGVRGLPRLTDRHEYTAEEVAKATFEFSEYTVENGPLPLGGFTTNLTHVEGG